MSELETEYARLSARVTELEAIIRQLVMERRRVLLDENAGLESAMGIEPRTSDLRKAERLSRKGMQGEHERA